MGLVMIGVSCSYKPRQEAVECIYTFGIAWMYGSCRSLSNSRGCARRSAFKLVGMLHAPCGFFHDFPEGCTISECILDRLKLEHYRMFFWQHRPSTSMIFKGIFEIQVEVETTNSMKKVEPLPRIAQKWHEPSTIPGTPSSAAPWCRSRHFHRCDSLKLHVSSCSIFERRMVAEQMQQLSATWRFS